MSDMAEMFFNAWFGVMGAPYPQHLFCSWHVDRAWQSNLNKISDKDKRAVIYKILKILQQETPESKFASALSNALSYMCNNEDTKQFGEYFANTYSHNFKKWAYCFRKEASINTNMHLESMHKVIKYFYLERKTVKRLDKGLNVVLKYVRDKSVERIIRLSKGGHTKQTRLLSQNHKEALKNSDEYIILKNDTNWNISKSENTSYTIHQVLQSKCCEQICLFCEACNHMFSCTFRKLLRFGRFGESLYATLPLFEQEDVTVRYTLILSKIANSLFLLADHILWLGRADLYTINTEKWGRISNKYWLYSITMNLVRDFYEISQIMKFNRRSIVPKKGVNSFSDILQVITKTYIIFKANQNIDTPNYHQELLAFLE
ncbi:hypothetical protein NQ317_016512 [Molorchus minor]|uniref:MULE transposase domain-containing protein n=1 Tax=Molorchus minor TaxID=1323400 RepID=A0ABQ9JC18_9CUCU|nr:hypothetical protein NQ317_016512 [Molorchus minor]